MTDFLFWTLVADFLFWTLVADFLFWTLVADFLFWTLVADFLFWTQAADLVSWILVDLDFGFGTLDNHAEERFSYLHPLMSSARTRLSHR